MSSDDLANAVSEITRANAIAFATSALVFYDFLITFGQEIRTVWQRRFSVVSLLIVSTRWVLLFEAATVILPNGYMSCTVISWMNEAPILVGFVQTAIFSALRICALWNRNYTLFTIVLVLSLAPVLTNACFFALSTSDYVPSPLNVCLQTPYFDERVENILLFCTRIPLIVADALVLLLTWVKTYRQYREAKSLKIESPLATCLVQDGTIYFFVLMVLNVAQIATFDSSNDTIVPIVSAFTTVMPPILVCRFMMNLRQVVRGDELTTGLNICSRVPPLSSPAVFVANMGEPLDYSQDDSVDDDMRTGSEQEVRSEDGLTFDERVA